MQVKQIFDPEKVTIIQFTLQKGNVESPEIFDLEKVHGHRTNHSLKFGFNLEEKLVRADYEIEIETNSNGGNKKEAKGNFHFVYLMQIENLEELAPISKNKKSVDLHASLANALASITYSTSRGILLTRLQGTALQKFILPVVDPMSLLTNDLKAK